jgi:glycerophosphoryl diester phosphodiesterase
MIFPPSPRPLIGAHRGASEDAPENTLAAFDLAVEQGAELIELDVHLSADGHLVVHHDFDLLRTAGRAERVEELDLSELQQLDIGAWKGPRYRGEHIPTLDTVLARYGQRVFLNVEIKVDTVPYAAIEDQVANGIAAHGLRERVVVSTFDVETFLRLRRLNADVRASLLFELPPAVPAAVSQKDSLAVALTFAAQHGAVGLHLDHTVITGAVVDRAAALSLGVLAWTVDDEREMARLAGLGVEAILSNRPRVLREQLLSFRSASGA